MNVLDIIEVLDELSEKHHTTVDVLLSSLGDDSVSLQIDQFLDNLERSPDLFVG
jgi:hypothetical protein